MARYTKCPFYIDDNKLTISCEDVVRLFDSQDSKLSHMDAYCDHEWENCEYANALNKAYDALKNPSCKAVYDDAREGKSSRDDGHHVLQQPQFRHFPGEDHRFIADLPHLW